jgi:N-glycosylase/DNA lyase
LHERRTFGLRVDPIDLDVTLGCGQTFRWKRSLDGSWTGVVGRNLLRLKEARGGLDVEAIACDRGVERELATYLRADDDIGSIQKALSKDPVLSNGLSELKGLRLVKMDEWECLVSYLLATYANIPRITKMVESVATGFGDEILDGVHMFPTVTDLQGASRKELERCGLGYRAGYLKALCDVLDRSDIGRLKRLEYMRLRDELKGLPGVGDKVADCVSLFGFGRLEAFPIDVWIKRSFSRLYGVTGPYTKLRGFAHLRFGDFAGYAQEYLFHNERALAPAGGCVFSEER